MLNTYYLNDADWSALSDMIIARPSLCDALGINRNTQSGMPGWDEIADVVCGQLGIYPERFRADFEAEEAATVGLRRKPD